MLFNALFQFISLTVKQDLDLFCLQIQESILLT